MSVKYRLYQNNRKGSSTIGMWYGRAVVDGETTIDSLAETIAESCTVTKADILAVITELVVAMKRDLQNSRRVVLPGFGSFKIGISTRPAQSAKDFNVTKNVKGIHVIFQPELHIDQNKQRIKTFLSGCKVEELADYHVEKEEPQKP